MFAGIGQARYREPQLAGGVACRAIQALNLCRILGVFGIEVKQRAPSPRLKPFGTMLHVARMVISQSNVRQISFGHGDCRRSRNVAGKTEAACLARSKSISIIQKTIKHRRPHDAKPEPQKLVRPFKFDDLHLGRQQVKALRARGRTDAESLQSGRSKYASVRPIVKAKPKIMVGFLLL
jgi:hypothetical protein